MTGRVHVTNDRALNREKGDRERSKGFAAKDPNVSL